MTQKHFAIIFVGVLIIAVVALGFSKFSTGPSESSPSPSSSIDPLFNQPQDRQAQSQQQTNKQEVSKQTQQKAIKQFSSFPGELRPEQLKNKKAVIQTDKGNIEFEIYPEATKAASNFIILTANNFYNGLTFHRVVAGFVIQGGDPKGDGTGGPGYTFAEDKLIKQKYVKGVVAMAKKGDEPAGTGGSQFFIMLADNPLPPDYVIFGQVIKGQEIVDSIQVGDVMRKVSIEALR